MGHQRATPGVLSNPGETAFTVDEALEQSRLLLATQRRQKGFGLFEIRHRFGSRPKDIKRRRSAVQPAMPSKRFAGTPPLPGLLPEPWSIVGAKLCLRPSSDNHPAFVRA